MSFKICEVTAINLIPICLLEKALLITYTSIHKRDKVLGIPDGFKSFFKTPCMTIYSGDLQKHFKIILFCSVTIKGNCASLSYCVAISMKLMKVKSFFEVTWYYCFQWYSVLSDKHCVQLNQTVRLALVLYGVIDEK